MKRFLIVTAVLMGLLLAACGKDPTPTPTPTATPAAPASPTPCGQGVSVELGGRVVTGQPRTYFVEPDTSCAPSGSVTFNVHNAGAIPHEFIVYRTDLAADALTVDLAAAVLEPSDIAGNIDQAQLGPGQSASVTVDLDPGSYVLLCNITTHYELGMRTAFTVGGGQS